MHPTSSSAFNKAMGTVVRRHRKSHGMTQEDVGRALEVSYQQVQKSERGINAFSAFQLTKVAGLFGIPVSQLYENAGIAVVAGAPTAAESDAFLAARYVARIANDKLRGSVVDFTRKLAYQGEPA